MRYEIRWANGSWRLFDVDQYTTVELFFIKREADAACERANGARR